MTLEEFTGILEETGIPFAYDHFEEGESPDPPFSVICFRAVRTLPLTEWCISGSMRYGWNFIRTGRIQRWKQRWRQCWMLPGFFITNRKSGFQVRDFMRFCSVL